MEMLSQETLLLIFMSLGAAFVQRVSGFGFGIFIMTVLPYLLPTYGEATTLSGLLACVTSLIISIRLRNYIRWKKLLPTLITFCIVSFFAVQFVAQAGDGMMKKVLGGILIFASIWFLWLNDKIKVPSNMPMQISMGTLSGILGGLFGMQGPPVVLYYIATLKSKEEYIAILQAYFLIGNIFMTVYRAQCGFLTDTVLSSWCYGIIAVLVGTWLGTLVFRRLSMNVLRKIIYIYMAISGIIAIA